LKIVVIGGTGLIGKKLVTKLRQKGHEVVAASLSTGINIVTGEGLAEALAGTRVVIDVANSPSFEDEPVMEFFQRSGRNILAAETSTGVAHHVALSVVGTDRLLKSGYFRAKMVQEELIQASKTPYTIVRSTQFFEFTQAIAMAGTSEETIHISPALYQPIAAEDVADLLVDIALAPPVNGIVEIAGPEPLPLDDAVRRFLRAKEDDREVIADPEASYFGLQIDDQSLTPGANARLGATRFDAWLMEATGPKSANSAVS
jgi:uncharacterized protein YbjT (DUF2867 family)